MGCNFGITAMPSIPREAVTRADALKLFRYNPETGAFMWNVMTRGHAKVLRPGDPAGWLHDGYHFLLLYQNEVRAHHVAWLIVTGEWPPAGMDVDHRDRDRLNNRWSNLRLASRSQNSMNAKVRRDNKSGFRGVHPAKNGRWFARICKDQRIIGLGTFDTIEAAAAARAKAERELFGEFAVAQA